MDLWSPGIDVSLSVLTPFRRIIQSALSTHFARPANTWSTRTAVEQCSSTDQFFEARCTYERIIEYKVVKQTMYSLFTEREWVLSLCCKSVWNPIFYWLCFHCVLSTVVVVLGALRKQSSFCAWRNAATINVGCWRLKRNWRFWNGEWSILAFWPGRFVRVQLGDDNIVLT